MLFPAIVISHKIMRSIARRGSLKLKLPHAYSRFSRKRAFSRAFIPIKDRSDPRRGLAAFYHRGIHSSVKGCTLGGIEKLGVSILLHVSSS